MVNLGFHLASPLYVASTETSIIAFPLYLGAEQGIVLSFGTLISSQARLRLASLKDDHRLAQSELNSYCLKMKECDSQISSILKKERSNQVLANHARMCRQVP
ncbi:uncharacterized protein LOC132617201 [Lycium barbarum]|uniref:uncharacterized protein LOC132617201 n=1 Tax=Lycium barbarum TaxID=112863 RepID=UPI00293F33FA|nr:uncharacterized protein LOC132617201 [Lycium barbarum]